MTGAAATVPIGNPAQVMVFGATRRLGDTEAMTSVDLSAQGGLITVLGPNGAGKSTLLRCLATVWLPDSGSVLIDGLDPRHESDRTEIRRRVGYLPQNSGLAESATVFDVVDYLAVMKSVGRGSTHPERWRRLEVMELLGLVGLADRATDKVGSLSGGMRQRVALAQALLGQPSLLLLDEPCSGLDPEERSRLRSILGERRRRATIIQSTHLTEQAAFGDRILVMASGMIRFDGSPARLAGLADGKAWSQPNQPAADATRTYWMTTDGHYRCLGSPPPGAKTVEPTVEDGYLLLLNP
ncbi:MAG: ATP-binding cassette domain-containing protein [Acidimicrobiia bacterium]|nr:ATP-binding cassette domain-containing protein [Acidimicrobiia bacterium]